MMPTSSDNNVNSLKHKKQCGGNALSNKTTEKQNSIFQNLKAKNFRTSSISNRGLPICSYKCSTRAVTEIETSKAENLSSLRKYECLYFSNNALSNPDYNQNKVEMDSLSLPNDKENHYLGKSDNTSEKFESTTSDFRVSPISQPSGCINYSAIKGDPLKQQTCEIQKKKSFSNEKLDLGPFNSKSINFSNLNEVSNSAVGNTTEREQLDNLKNNSNAYCKSLKTNQKIVNTVQIGKKGLKEIRIARGKQSSKKEGNIKSGRIKYLTYNELSSPSIQKEDVLKNSENSLYNNDNRTATNSFNFDELDDYSEIADTFADDSYMEYNRQTNRPTPGLKRKALLYSNKSQHKYRQSDLLKYEIIFNPENFFKSKDLRYREYIDPTYISKQNGSFKKRTAYQSIFVSNSQVQVLNNINKHEEARPSAANSNVSIKPNSLNKTKELGNLNDKNCLSSFLALVQQRFTVIAKTNPCVTIISIKNEFQLTIEIIKKCKDGLINRCTGLSYLCNWVFLKIHAFSNYVNRLKLKHEAQSFVNNLCIHNWIMYCRNRHENSIKRFESVANGAYSIIGEGYALSNDHFQNLAIFQRDKITVLNIYISYISIAWKAARNVKTSGLKSRNFCRYFYLFLLAFKKSSKQQDKVSIAQSYQHSAYEALATYVILFNIWRDIELSTKISKEILTYNNLLGFTPQKLRPLKIVSFIQDILNSILFECLRQLYR